MLTHVARCGLEETHTSRLLIGSPEEYVHGHTLPIMLTQINTKLKEYVEDKDEDMESRGSGFVVLYAVSQAWKSCWEWNFGGDHA